MNSQRFFNPKFFLIFVLGTFLFGFFINFIEATTYYVDATNGNDSWQGNLSYPWKTISKVNSVEFSPGDRVYFKRGEEWNETLVINSSGTSGNSIIYGAYGFGEKPKLDLTKEITGWTQYSGNIYVADVGFSVGQLFINGERYSVARDPNLGYHYIDEGASATNISIIDYNLSVSTENLTGSEIWIRLHRWYLSGFSVTNFSDGNISLSDSLNSLRDGSAEVNEGYILMNKFWMLDSGGEWFYDSNEEKLYLYSYRNPEESSAKIEVSSSYSGVNISDVSNIILNDFEIFGADEFGINLDDSQNITISSFSILSAGYSGIKIDSTYSYAVENILIENNLINNSGFYGIYTNSGTKNNLTILNNSISNTMGLIVSKPNIFDLDYSTNWGKGSGILLRSSNSSILNNTINDSGYSCISMLSGMNNLVEYNVIQRCCLKLDDGGGIYVSGAKNFTIKQNIVINSVGNNEGTPQYFTSGTTQAQGIYLDVGTSFCSIYNNTVINSGFAGLQNGISSNLTIVGNVFYNNSYTQLVFSNQSTLGTIEGNNVSGNVFFSLRNQTSLYFLSNQSSNEGFGVFNNNIYFKGSLDYVLKDVISSGTTYYSLSYWEKNKSQELNGSSVSDFYEVNNFNVTFVNDSEELIVNGDFDSDYSPWYRWPTTSDITWNSECALGSGCLEFYSDNDSVRNYASLRQSFELSILDGSIYLLNLDAVAEDYNAISTKIFYYIEPSITTNLEVFCVNSIISHYEAIFIAPDVDVDYNPFLFFSSDSTHTHYWVDNVSLKEVENVYYNDLDDDSQILINTENSAKTFYLDTSYCTIENEIVSDSITIEPFMSEILLSCFCNNDYVCNNKETCSTCPNDCGVCSSEVQLTSSSYLFGGSSKVKINFSSEDLRDGLELQVKKNYEVEFEFGNETKILKVDWIYSGKVNFSIDGKTYSVWENFSIEIDLNGDGIGDLEVSVNEIVSDFANINLKLINSENFSGNTSNVEGAGEILDKNKWILISVAGLVILILVGVKVLKRKL